MAPKQIFQFKQPFPAPNFGPAEKDLRLNAHIGNLLGAEDLFNINPDELILFILQSEPQGLDLPIR